MKAPSNIIPAKRLWPWVICALLAGIVLGRGSRSGHESHHLFVYPDKDRLTKWVNCGDFESLKKAREAGVAWLKYFPEGDGWGGFTGQKTERNCPDQKKNNGHYPAAMMFVRKNIYLDGLRLLFFIFGCPPDFLFS